MEVIREERHGVLFSVCPEMRAACFPHGFSTRLGGVSPPPWDSLNLGGSCGDQPERVSENFRRFCAAAGTDPDRLVKNQQVHGDTVRAVTGADVMSFPGQPGTVEALARMTVLNSSFLKWRFAYVAKKFGIVEKDADHRFMNFGRLFDLHRDTPAYREAVDKVLWEDLDIENTEKAVSMMRSGEIGVSVSTVSPMGMEGITRSKELMQPLRADHSILMALKRRLENEVLYASCLNCAAQWRFRVGDAPRRFICPRCGGNMIAALKEYDRDKIKLFAADRSALSAEERKDMARVRRIANLVNEDGRKAAMTLAGRGVGPDSASRILRSMHTDEDEFLRDILSAEVLFARNKRFWD